MAGSTITIRTDPNIANQIASLAQAMERSRNWVIEDALRQYIATQSWQIEGIQAAQAALAQGEGVTMDEAMQELDALIEHAEQRRAGPSA